MPVSVVVAFESAGAAVAPEGQQLHGWLLNCVGRIDPALADRLHASDRAKPFAVMALASPVVQYRWRGAARVTSLDEEFGEVLVNLDSRDMEFERLGRVKVRVASLSASAKDHPLARAESYSALISRASSRRPPETLSLDFLSPTAFAADDRAVTLFPHPHLVFRSLAGKWNRYAPVEFRLDPGLVDELGFCARVEHFDLRTEDVRQGPRRLKGFVGRCEYTQQPGTHSNIWAVAHLLSDFALYAGVGQKTTMGMGQTVGGRWCE